MKLLSTSCRFFLLCLFLLLFSAPERAVHAQPAVFLSDLDMGILMVGASSTRRLEICNVGNDPLRFEEPWLTWRTGDIFNEGFDVADTEINKLKGLTLGKDECVELAVTFTAGKNVGHYATTCRVWANTRVVRDTGTWRASVIAPGPQIDGYDWGKQWLSANPCTKNPVPYYLGTAAVRNAGTAPFTIENLVIVNDPDGVYQIGPTNISSGMVMQPSDKRDIEVIFDPKEEKSYSAMLRLNYRIRIDDRDSTGFVEMPLQGIGIESYVAVADFTFDPVVFTGPGNQTRMGQVLVSSTGTRPVTLDHVFLSPSSHFQISPVWAAANSWATASDGNVRIISPGEAITVYVEFSPQDADPPQKEGELNLEGDFAVVNCPGSMSDSTGALRGSIAGTTGVADEGSIDRSFSGLRDISPNPAMGETSITFDLFNTENVRLELYTSDGRKVTSLLEGEREKGRHTLLWDASGVAAGVYYLQLTAGDRTDSRSVRIVR